MNSINRILLKGEGDEEKHLVGNGIGDARFYQWMPDRMGR
jgi:hypothetical protein